MKKKHFLKLSFLVLVLCSCSIHKNSYRNDGAITEVDLVYESNSDPDEEEAVTAKGIISTVAEPIIKFVVKTVKNKIDEEAEKHIANYSAKISEFGFYNKDTLPNHLVFKRSLKGEQALHLDLGIEYIDSNSFMILKPKKLKVDYTKAKVALLYKDGEIDTVRPPKFVIKADVKIKAAWIDKELKKHIEVIGEADFLFQNVVYNKTYSEFKNKESGIMLSIPKSYNLDGSENKKGGYCEIEVTITEIDQREKTLKKVAKLIGDNNDEIVDALLDLISKDDEDE